MTHEIEVKDAEFLKVSTNIYGGLRFKTDKETDAVKMYADQISTSRQTFSDKEVRDMPGFKLIKVKDVTRCLKPSQRKSSVDFSLVLSAD
ncbi:hypothetical protein PM8797T_10869 [Gimesia maris DSM 8797]|nr:hypothetical protein PM8797T_10869 [Gimesia maris DSM 8797]